MVESILLTLWPPSIFNLYHAWQKRGESLLFCILATRYACALPSGLLDNVLAVLRNKYKHVMIVTGKQRQGLSEII